MNRQMKVDGRLAGLIQGLALVMLLCGVSGSAQAQTVANVGMPFTGSWDKYAYSPPGSHGVFHGWTGAQFSTDIYAAAGTAVRFNSSTSGIRGWVKSVTNVPGCTTSTNTAADAGKYVVVELENTSGSKLGVAVYVHLDNVQVTANTYISSGTTLGYLKRWAKSSCWNVTDGAGVHAHFEAGSYSTASNGKGCWIPDSKTSLSSGSNVAKVGVTGATSVSKCP